MPTDLEDRKRGNGGVVPKGGSKHWVSFRAWSMDSQKHGQEPKPRKQTSVQAPRRGRVGAGDRPASMFVVVWRLEIGDWRLEIGERARRGRDGGVRT
jgi:hypothetical protein